MELIEMIKSIYLTGYDQGFHEAEKENIEIFMPEWEEKIKVWALEMVGKDYEEEIYQGPDSAPEFDERAVIANEEKKRIRERINK